MQNNNNKIAIIGAGLAGCTLAILLKKKGYDVSVYEETEPSNKTLRSINLALSFRGVQALKAIGLWDKVKAEKMYSPMIGRYYHLIGNKPVPDEKCKWWYSHKHTGNDAEFNHSIMRSSLNFLLYDEMKKSIGNANIHIAEVSENILDNLKVDFKSGGIVCADGLPTKLDLKSNFFLKDKEYHEKEYEFSYFEIKLKATELNKIAKYKELNDENDYLHIWSLGNNFMIAALPNSDNSHNCLVFFPNEGNKNELEEIAETNKIDEEDNDEIKNEKRKESYKKWSQFLLMKFGNENKEIGQKFIHSCEVDTIKVTKLRDLKCDNWVKENLLMIGDSAHAVLPFHGQGANAAMEDALILSNLIPDFKDGNEVNWNKIFHSFFKKRKPDADALLQLGRLNHFSMIGNDSRQIEKHDIKLKLEEFYNNDFESEYHMVTFSDKSYSAALKRFYSEDALATYILDYHEQNEKYRFKNANEEIKADTKRLIIKHKMLETEQADMLNQIKHQYQFQNDKELEVLLEGLSSKESQGVTYWDYVETDTLLSLQKPKTFYPDEVIFITYHQLCELYFKLIIQEIERLNDFYENDIAKKVYKISHINFLKDKEGKVVQGDDGKNIIVELDELETWTECFKRVERYWQNLITSFDVLKSGLSTAEFLEFRKALLPASGFQTYQFRKMELMLTPLRNLTIPTSENEHEIYWRKGAMNKTGSYQESKLLKNFNAKYDNVFFDLVNFFKGKTILDRFEALNSELQKEIKPMLVRTENTILLWKVAHMHMIYQHIPSTESATGGTDYINYLPQLREYKTKVVEFNKKYQVLYFPDFWKDRNANEYISKLIADLPIEISKVIAKLYAGDNPTQTKRPE